MSRKEYNQREIEILTGAMELIADGCNPHTIKVSDIAQAANIGKGTIYDYFSSKEELIREAIHYHVDKEIDLLYDKVKGQVSFKDKYFQLMTSIDDSFRRNLAIHNILLSNGLAQGFYHNLKEGESCISGSLNKINDLILSILDEALEEGVRSSHLDETYLMMASRGSLMAFAHYLSKPEDYNFISLQEAMERSYEILLKSLA